MAEKQEQAYLPVDGGERPERGPWIRLDGCRVEYADRKRAYEVVIKGFNLRGAVAPPEITVGGEPLHRLEFQPDGRAVRGILEREPRGRKVIVDYGFARAELEEWS